MGRMAGTSLRALTFGAALAALTALLCLSFAAARDTRTISLSELTAEEAPLMSCEPSSSSYEGLMWCSDPSSPHCIPAAPEAPRLELADRPDLALQAVLPEQQATYVLVPWPATDVAANFGRKPDQRLERPPRA